MKDKNLDFLAQSDDKLRRAEQTFLNSLQYDDGLPARSHSGRYYDFGGIVNAVGSTFKSVIGDSLDTTYDTLKAQKDYNNRSVLSGVSDNDALLMAADNLDWGSTKKAKDFRSESVMDDISDSVMAGISGAAATKSPWGLLAALPVAGRKIVDRVRAKNQADKWNEGLSDYRADLSRMLGQAADRVDTINDRRLLEAFYNSAAFGGTLSTHGGDWNNGLTFINAGGTHESNPNEGVPAGKDENGTPNLVEEGEVIWDNEYVFSNRLRVPQKLRNKYKLGGPITYADAIKKLTKESEERKNDPISNATNKAIVNEFIDSQEEVRAKKQQRAAERLQQAQYENELLNAIAGLGAEQAPMGPVDMQMPAQEVPQEAPVIEQMSAYGGNLFAGGGPKKKNGAWYVTDPNSGVELRFATETAAQSAYNRWYPKNSSEVAGEDNGQSLWNKLTAPQTNVESTTRKNSNDSVSENSDVEDFLEGIGAYADSGIDSALRNDLRSRAEKVYNRAKRKYEEGSIAYNRAVNNGLGEIMDYLEEKEVDSKRIQDEYSIIFKRGVGLNAASDYLRQLGYKNTNSAPRDLSPAEKATYQALLTGEYKNATDYYNKKSISQTGSSAQTQASTGASIGGTNTIDIPSGSGGGVREGKEEPEVENPEVPNEDKIRAEQERQRQLAKQKEREEAERKRRGAQQENGSANINYDRSINGKEFESQEYYQNFLNYLNGASDEEVNGWIDKINNDIKASGSSYKIQNKKDLIRLATDGKVGPVHQAFSKSANDWSGQNPTKRPSFGLEKPKNGLEGALEDYNNSLANRAYGRTELDVPDYREFRDVKEPRTPFDWRREAPILGAAAQSLFGLFGEPDYSEADAVLEAANRLGSPISIPVETIGDYVKRRPFDERYLVNMANQNRVAAERGAANTAGGNRAMQLGADAFLAHSNQQELGEIMRQAYLANRQDEFSTAEFNRGTNLQNMSAINSRNLAQAQLNTQREQAAFNGTLYGRNMRQQIYDRDVATTGANLSNLFNNLSIRGKEAITDRMVESMYEQGYYPHKMNPDGTIEFAPIENRTIEKNGGKLKKKRRF